VRVRLTAGSRRAGTQAALAVGYANPSHFAKLFKRRLGLSPSAWRRQNATG
jgi:AraC-like DNA-binding protein